MSYNEFENVYCLIEKIDKKTATNKNIVASICGAWQIYQWRISKQNYRFHPELFKTLTEQFENKLKFVNIPAEILSRLERPIFIDGDLTGDGSIGTLYWIDNGSSINNRSLVILHVSPKIAQGISSNKFSVINISPNKSINTCIDDFINGMKHVGNKAGYSKADTIRSATIRAFSLLLYVLSDNSDIVQDPDNVQTYRPMDINNIRDKYREIKIFNVGYNMANLLASMRMEVKEMKANGNDRAYIRSGHWRESWVGTKAGNTPTLKLNWIMPTIVNPSVIDEEKIDAESQQSSIDVDELFRTIDKLKMELDSKDQDILCLTRDVAKLQKKYMDLEQAYQSDRNELISLREIVFSNETYIDDDDNIAKKEEIFPWYTDKKITVFGGHPSWVNNIRFLLPNIRFVDKDSYSVNSNLIKNSDVIWLQPNAMAHTLYNGIMSVVKKYNKPVKYFKHAGVKKCAIQLVEEMSK